MLQGFAKHGEYVDFGESWLVYLVQQTGKKILVDGTPVIISYTGSKQVFIKPDSVVEILTTGSKTHTGWKHKVTGDVLTKEEYTARYHGEYYDEEECEYVYPDLSSEFAHRSLQQYMDENYEHIYHITPDTTEIVKLVCVGSATPTGSPYIETALAYGKTKFSSSGFYRVDWSKLVAGVLFDFVKEYDLQKEFSNSDHSNVRFAKIKGNYILSDKIKGAEQGKFGVFSDLSEAKRAVDDHTKWMKNYLYTKVFGNGIVLDKVTVGNVISQLESLYNSINNLEVKQKSYGSKISLVSKIESMIDNYQRLGGEDGFVKFKEKGYD